MSGTVDFPEGLLVHIQDEASGLIVRRKEWGTVPMQGEGGFRAQRVLLNFGIYEPESNQIISTPVPVTLVVHYFRSDYERAGNQRPTLLLWDEEKSSWNPAVPNDSAKQSEDSDVPALEQFGSDEVGILIARNVPVADPPVALG